MEPALPKTLAEAARQRRDIVSGEVMPEERLIRFVAGPDGSVVPDLSRKLPGRGLWVAATRAAVDMAVKKGGFSRSAKTPLKPAADLSDQIERLMLQRILDRLGLARRSGELTYGFEKAGAAIAGGRAAFLIEAVDGSADGRRKMLQIVARAERRPRLLGLFSCDELSLSLGLGNVIHLVFLAGRGAERLTEDVERLSGFRPLLPESGREGP